MIPLLVIRPEPGCSASLAAARALGLDARSFPLFEVRPLEWEAPHVQSFDALLIGSANAIRHGGPALTAFSGKPAYCVGESTAEAARKAGLCIAATGEGGLQDLLGAVAPEHRRVLRLAGRARVRLDVPAGLSVEERCVYASGPLAMPAPLSALLADPALVLLHSAEAARHFAAQCESRGIDRGQIGLAALAPRIADAAGPGWASVAIAAAPNDQALLALAREMCQLRGAPQG